MMKKKTAAVFPVFSDTIPIIRYLYSQSDEYNIVELLSPSGCGVCGMDAGYADNKSHLGITVVDYKNSRFDGWDYLILLNHAHNERDGYEAANEGVLRKAGALGKRILTHSEAMSATLSKIGKTDSDLTSFQRLNRSDNHDMSILEQYASHEMRYPNVVTVLVGELINDYSGLSPFLNLYHSLSKYAKVVLITTETNLCLCGAISLQPVLGNMRLSERDKILYMNKAVCDIYDNLNPDIIMIYSDKPLFAYNDRIYGDFGVSMYMITQAINITYFVSSIPTLYFDPIYINELTEQTENCFGVPIDFASISNTFVDDAASSNTVHTPICHVAPEKVQSMLQRCKSVNLGICNGDLTSEDCVDECVDSIMAILDDKRFGSVVFEER